MANAGDRTLARRGALAVLAMEAIASWSNVEAFMLSFFVTLLGGETLASTVYLALDGSGPKMAAIRAAASAALGATPERLSLFRALLDIAKTNQKARDKLAHWTWGYSPQLPDALLLVDPKALSLLDRKDILVYKDTDFEEIISANDRLCGYCMDFGFVLQDHPANAGNRLFEGLCAQPEIREWLSRRSGQRD